MADHSVCGFYIVHYSFPFCAVASDVMEETGDEYRGRCDYSGHEHVFIEDINIIETFINGDEIG